MDCPMLKKYEDEPERWLDIEWNDDIKSDKLYPVRLHVVIADKPSALATVSTTVSKYNSNISHLFTTSKSPGFMELTMDVDVKNAEHLEEVMTALKALPIIISVEKAWKA